jgi:citrate synthase
MTPVITPARAWIGAADAARLLDVSRATLYAYVSRGYIRSQSKPGVSRERRYSRDDVERLRRRTEARRDPDKAATHTLQWGMPVLESSITLIDDETLYYRGHDAVTLSQSRSVEEVAALIWTGSLTSPFLKTPPPAPLEPRPLLTSKSLLKTVAPKTVALKTGAPRLMPPQVMPLRRAGQPFIARAQAALADASTHDPLAFDLRPDRVAQTGWRILHQLTHVATAASAAIAATAATAGATAAAAAATANAATAAIDQTLARAWGVGPRGVDLLRSALILCADHELNVSSFTARCVASAGGSPYAVVIAGLAALSGLKHGAMTARVDAMLDALRRTKDLPAAIADRLRRGEPLHGFGHPLYRTGDPRAAALLALLRDRYPKSPDLTFATAVAAAATTALRESPTIDFALTILSRVLRLPPGSALTLFAIGRTIGWIGHAIEQYATDQLIRPRAKYVGALPAAASRQITASQVNASQVDRG